MMESPRCQRLQMTTPMTLRKRASRSRIRANTTYYYASSNIPSYQLPADHHIGYYATLGTESFRATTKIYRLLDYILSVDSDKISYRRIRNELLIPDNILRATLLHLDVDGYIKIDIANPHNVRVPNTNLYVYRTSYVRTTATTVLRDIPYNHNALEERSLRKLFTGTTKSVHNLPDIKTYYSDFMAKSERILDKRPKWYMDKDLAKVTYGDIQLRGHCKRSGNRWSSCLTMSTKASRGGLRLEGQEMAEVDTPLSDTTLMTREIILGVSLPHLGNYRLLEAMGADPRVKDEAKRLYNWLMGPHDGKNKHRVAKALGFELDVDAAKKDVRKYWCQLQPGTVKYIKSKSKNGNIYYRKSIANGHEFKFGEFMESNFPSLALYIRELKRWMWSYGGYKTLYEYIEYLESKCYEHIKEGMGRAPCIRLYDACYVKAQHERTARNLMWQYLILEENT